jgi:hypothetical protein
VFHPAHHRYRPRAACGPLNTSDAGDRQAHDPKVTGSNPVPATKKQAGPQGPALLVFRSVVTDWSHKDGRGPGDEGGI